ncbi:MAG: hypothetical protein AABW91_03045 [Nanoarchaeota archaeon]
MNKTGQVWVETVVYTLIGLVLIGTILAFATPAIQKQKNKSIITSTINSMNEFDNQILSIKRAGIANTRNFDFLISDGKVTIDSINDKIIFNIPNSKYVYSEPGAKIPISGTNMDVMTTQVGDKYEITLTLDYSVKTKINITYEGEEQSKILNPASTPYSLVVENKGKLPEEELINVDVYEISR